MQISSFVFPCVFIARQLRGHVRP